MGFKVETKTIGALDRVAHKTQAAESGGLAQEVKLEYKPAFKPFGRATQWTIAGNQATVLNGLGSLTGLTVTAKTAITSRSTITAKYPLDKKKPAVSIKFETAKFGPVNNWVNELKLAKGGPLCVESEVYLGGRNKFQVETIGKKVDAVKLTHTAGKNQMKLKYIVATQAPVIGLDTYHADQKWDFEYNVKSEVMSAKVKVSPLTLAASSKIGRQNGFGPVSYKLTAERNFFW